MSSHVAIIVRRRPVVGISHIIPFTCLLRSPNKTNLRHSTSLLRVWEAFARYLWDAETSVRYLANLCDLLNEISAWDSSGYRGQTVVQFSFRRRTYIITLSFPAAIIWLYHDYSYVGMLCVCWDEFIKRFSQWQYLRQTWNACIKIC